MPRSDATVRQKRRNWSSSGSPPWSSRRAPGRHQVTAVLTATSSTVSHSNTTRRTPHAHVAREIRDLHASVNRRTAALSKSHSQVIIVSEPSAEAARRASTGRSIPARSRNSTPHNDTPQHADARPISVHAEVLARDPRPLNSPRDRPTSAHRHQGRRHAASLARWRKRHP
jgi:hypothetical protein